MNNEQNSHNTILLALVGGLAIVLAVLGGLLLLGDFGQSEPEPVADTSMESAESVQISAEATQPPDVTLPAPPQPTLAAVATATNTPIATNTPLPTATPLPADTPTPAPVAQVPAAVAAPPDTPIPPTPTAAGPCTLAEQNGMLVIDAEASAPVGGWQFENSAPGYIGSGYYTYRGAESLGSPGGTALTYPIFINNPGLYQVRIHNYHDHPNSTEGNDAWLQISGVQGWIKTWSGDRALWNWGNNFELSVNNHTGPEVNFPAAGAYTLQISGRSPGFSVDRVIIVTPDQFIAGTNQALPQSPCQP